MSKFLPCVLTDEHKQLEWHQFIPRHSEEMPDINTSFQRSLQMTTWDTPAWSRQRSCSCVKHLLMLVLMSTESYVVRLFHRNRPNQHILQTFRGHYRWQHGISLPEVGRDICSCVNCLVMVVLVSMESWIMRLFHRNRLNQHILQTFDDVCGKMCGEK